MAKRPRLTIAGVPQYVIQRGINRQATFFADADYRLYLPCLGQADVDTGGLEEIRDTVNKGWPLGSERFKNEVEAALQRATRPPKRGRPAKNLNGLEQN